MSKAISVVVPYNRLRLSASNVRRTRGTPAYKAGIVALAASILSTHKQTGQGLLQNLVGHKVEGDFVDVAAGGRRFDAISFLVESGEFTDDYPVPVLIVGADAVTAASLSENVQREAMHPADEYDAFLSLVEQGWSIDRIADGFGVTPLVVERRLKLRAAAPALLADFREGLMSTDQLIALCSTDNHVRQLEVWSRVRHQTWNKEPHALRRAVIETEVEAAKDSRVVFIGGVEAYEKAGGMVRRDLFASEGEGVILEDSALLDRLVDEKLHEHSEEVGTEGWGWVEVWPQLDYTTFDRLGKVPRKTVELSDGAKQQLTALEKELEDAQTAVEDLMEKGDRTDEYEARLDALDEVIERLESEIADLQRSSVVYAAEVMEHAGALVVLQHGQLRIERGLVRSADRAKVASLLEDGQSISGGRETESAGRKADAISDALRRSLLGHRNLAAQFVAATNAKVAKILLVCQLVTSIRNTPSAAPTDMSVTNGYGTRTYCVISDEAGQAKGGDFVALGEGLVKELPQEHGELWDALEAMSVADLDKLLAYAVARSVSLATDAGGLSAKFLEALGLNMADHFAPTASNYLGRVSKDLIIEALVEAGKIGGDDDRNALLAMKKGALAQEAESRLAGSGWVPSLIRVQSAKPAPKKREKAGSKAESRAA